MKLKGRRFCLYQKMKTSPNKTLPKWRAYVSLGIGMFFSSVGLFIFFPILKNLLEILREKSLYFLIEFLTSLFKGFFLSPIVLIVCTFQPCGHLVYFFFFILFLLIIGIFLGIQSLKSLQRKIAILGIILCTIDLIIVVFIFEILIEVWPR
jgi:hypothetical protein